MTSSIPMGDVNTQDNSSELATSAVAYDPDEFNGGPCLSAAYGIVGALAGGGSSALGGVFVKCGDLLLRTMTTPDTDPIDLKAAATGGAIVGAILGGVCAFLISPINARG